MTAKKRTKKHASAKSSAKAQATFTRTYKGEEHRVTTAKDGTLRYRGECYRSLTAIAKAITGYKAVSGPRFFGVDGGSR